MKIDQVSAAEPQAESLKCAIACFSAREVIAPILTAKKN
jgi:hypothetical protein